jgi:hypothetical protein
MQSLSKCPAAVQAYNLNDWLSRERNPDLFFRFDGDDVRAIFTPRYQSMDNVEVLKRLDRLGYGPYQGAVLSGYRVHVPEHP